ncbi:hypothetical protein VWY15_01120, partial [Phaeobacter sp. Ax3a-5a]|uniref:hypothetical protein n=1 Tax=Phaeobacter sp. Ax3a-5a TaxID=3112436 RepID=UPI003A884C6B
MADKTTPGGVLYDPVTGQRLDESSAVNLDAKLREMSAKTATARAELGARVTDVAAESEARDDTLYEQVQQVRAEVDRLAGTVSDTGTGAEVDVASLATKVYASQVAQQAAQQVAQDV